MDPEEVEVKNAEVKNVEVKNADRRKWVIGAALARATISRHFNFSSVGHPKHYKSSLKKPENQNKTFITKKYIV